MSDYDIQRKVTHIVTDNGSNFVKAFREYAAANSVDVDDLINDASGSSSEEMDWLMAEINSVVSGTDGDCSAVDATKILTERANSVTYITHLQHIRNVITKSWLIFYFNWKLFLFEFRCALHTLNLIAKSDIKLDKFGEEFPKKIPLSNILIKLQSI